MSKRDRDTTKTAKRGLALALSLTALSLLLAAPSKASEPVVIAPEGPGAGEVRNPKGVAVHQASGALYVADTGNFRVLKFGPGGEFQLGIGAGVRDGVSVALQTCGPQAVPPSARCFRLNPLSSNPNFNAPGVIAPESVAVDQADGGVYVSDSQRRRVTKFSAQGEFLWMAGKGVNKGGGSPASPGNLCTAENLANGDACGAGAEGAGPGEFASPSALTTGPGGELWVGDSNRLHELNPDGTPGIQFSQPGAGRVDSLALDSEGDLYAISTCPTFSVCDSPRTDVRKLDGDTGAQIGVLAAGKDPRVVATDGSDNVYIGHCEELIPGMGGNCPSHPYRFVVFDPAGEQFSQFGAGQVVGVPGGGRASNALAVDDNAGTLYSAGNVIQAFTIPEPGPLVESQEATDLLPDSATLAARLNSEGHETSYRFEYGETSGYGQQTPSQTLAASFDSAPVSAGLSDLIPGTTYHFRLVATNHCNGDVPAEECTTEGPDTTFTAPEVVGIESSWATEVGATGAEIHALLDPFGQGASWWVEYGTGPCPSGGCDQASPEQGLPAVFGPQKRSVSLRGLQPGTAYHYRFVARGERGGVTYLAEGPERTLRTQRSGVSLQLPDGRAWEMVTPPNKNGALVLDYAGEGQLQAAASGGALAYYTRGPIDPNPAGDRNFEAGSVLGRRGPDGRWSATDLRVPSAVQRSILAGFGFEYGFFTPELDRGLLAPRDVGLIAPPGGELGPYLSTTTASPPYTALLGPHAEISPCTPPYGHGSFEPHISFSAVRAIGVSEQFERVVLQSSVPLACGAGNISLYRWSQEGIVPLSVTPVDEGEALVGAQLGSGRPSTVYNAFSADGNRAFWTRASSAALYLRDVSLGQSVRLDVVQPEGWGIGNPSPVFQGADRDGKVAFFTDIRQLTKDSSDSVFGGPDNVEIGRDLYRCEVAVVAGQLRCDLSNLTGPAIKVGKAAEVLGVAAGMSEQGDRVYFVARGVLDTAPNAYGDSATAGAPNLYLWRESGGVRFVGTLSDADAPDWSARGARHSAAASPSGRYLAFMSQRSLTGYDNRDAASGDPAQEVFLYDAADDELVCASCNPSDRRPRSLRPGVDDLGTGFDPLEIWEGKQVAAVLPTPRQLSNEGPVTSRTRVIHDNGRLFFNAADGLVGVDSNSDGDVYQYEPLGTGGCSGGSGGSGVARVEGGCVALLSAGTTEGTSAFLDASVGGDDVFFFSPGRLSVLDDDDETDIYDARVDGITAVRTPVAECQGEACQPPPQRPAAPTPASSVFAGPGNVAPSKGQAKKAKKAKKRCVRNKHTRKAQKKTAKAKSKRANAKKPCHAGTTRRAGR